MRDFVVHYRALAVPRLRRSARFLALLIVTGDREFHWALAELRAEAIRLGAAKPLEPKEKNGGELPLVDWRRDGARPFPLADYRRLMNDVLPSMLLSAVERLQPDWDEACAVADRVAVDIRRHQRAFDAHLAAQYGGLP